MGWGLCGPFSVCLFLSCLKPTKLGGKFGGRVVVCGGQGRNVSLPNPSSPACSCHLPFRQGRVVVNKPGGLSQVQAGGRDTMGCGGRGRWGGENCMGRWGWKGVCPSFSSETKGRLVLGGEV